MWDGFQARKNRASLTNYGRVMGFCPNAKVVLILPLDGDTGAQVRMQSNSRDCSMYIGRGLDQLEKDLVGAGVEVFKNEAAYYTRASKLFGQQKIAH